MTEQVYILLPVHNRREVTRKFAESLKSQTFSAYQLILIDDGSTDGTSDIVKELLPNTILLRGDGNLWWAGSLQVGFDWLKKNAPDEKAIILISNDDVIFCPQFIAEAVNEMRGRENTLLLAKRSCDSGRNVHETGIRADFRRLSFEIAKPGESINCLSTRGLFLRFGDMKKIGDFHPIILPHYLSDYEYTLRAFRLGMKCTTSDKVYLCPDFDTTGYHQFQDIGFFDYLRKCFSKKSALNPVYWTTFIFLASPAKRIIPCLVKVWIAAFKLFTKQLILSLKH
jgi:GT2 family glycosyltransferase